MPETCPAAQMLLRALASGADAVAGTHVAAFGIRVGADAANDDAPFQVSQLSA